MLDIASNRIKKIENISHLTELQEFWVSTGWSCSLKCLCNSERNPSDGEHWEGGVHICLGVNSAHAGDQLRS